MYRKRTVQSLWKRILKYLDYDPIMQNSLCSGSCNKGRYIKNVFLQPNAICNHIQISKEAIITLRQVCLFEVIALI